MQVVQVKNLRSLKLLIEGQVRCTASQQMGSRVLKPSIKTQPAKLQRMHSFAGIILCKRRVVIVAFLILLLTCSLSLGHAFYFYIDSELAKIQPLVANTVDSSSTELCIGS